MDAKTRNLALLTALSLFCAGVCLDSRSLCFGFGLFCARCSRRSRHSREALALTWASLNRPVNAPGSPYTSKFASHPAESG